MKLLRRSWKRICGLLFRRRREQEMADEFESHIHLQTEDNIRAGMDPEAARREARIKFGSIPVTNEAWREQAGSPWLKSTIQDIGGALRYFRRNRGFFVVAVVILALGIGATTAVFSMAETLLLRPLPYTQSDRLVTLRSVDTMSDYPSTRVAPGVLADWQINTASFEAIAGYRWSTLDLIDDAESDRLSGLLATPEFFDVFGVPLLGRSFQAEDRGARRPFEATDTGEAVVLGNEVWRRRFDGDEGLLGKAVDVYVLNFSRDGATRP